MTTAREQIAFAQLLAQDALDDGLAHVQIMPQQVQALAKIALDAEARAERLAAVVRALRVANDQEVSNRMAALQPGDIR